MKPEKYEPVSGASASASYDPSVEPAGLGVRTVGSDSDGQLHDVLRVTPDLGRPAIVELTVRERATRFATEDLAGLSSVVRVERVSADGRVEVWSRRTEGFRLSAVLEWSESREAAPSLEAALTVGDRLLAALSELQGADNTPGASGHGAIAIDQVVVDEDGRLTLTDHAFGTALASLQWPRERLWRRFRIAMPPAAGLARFDHRVDVTQAAVVICALLAGRLLRADEYPRDLEQIVAEAVRRSCRDADRDDRDRLLVWLRAATELDSRSAFPSAAAARQALRAALGHRLDDSAAVGRWLRAARGLPDAGPRAGAVRPVMSAVSPVTANETPDVTGPAPIDATATTAASSGGGLVTRVRQWISRP